MSEIKTIQTKYGEVEVETIECDSCGNTIGKEDAHEFTLGDREGHACDHCVDNGPISFPDTVAEWDTPVENLRMNDYGVVFYVILGFITLPIGTITGFSTQADDFRQGFTMGVIVFFVWVVLPLLLLLYFGVI
jgi:hypothetical protein